MDPELTAELLKGMSPLRLDVDGPFDDLGPLSRRVQEAAVVALGSAVRTSHELLALMHRLLRFLVERHGYRSVALEGDENASAALDTYVRTGVGDPRSILSHARVFLRFHEVLDAIRWIRARNQLRPDDPIHVVHPSRPLPESAGRSEIESHLADTTVEWHERTGHRIVYWGGLAHTAVGLAEGSNAGAHLRGRLGFRYVSIALLFHHGRLEESFDAPPSDHVEAVLAATGIDHGLVAIADSWSGPVRRWLDSSARVRLVGPTARELRGPALRDWFDFVIHARGVTPARRL